MISLKMSVGIKSFRRLGIGSLAAKRAGGIDNFHTRTYKTYYSFLLIMVIPYAQA